MIFVSDHRLLRDGVRLMLEGSRDVTLIAAVASVGDVVNDDGPDAAVVVLDVSTRGGVDLVRRLALTRSPTAVVAVGVPDDDTLVIGYAEAGITGYVTRDGTLAELVEAVRRAHCGESACTPRIASILLRQVASGHSVASDKDEVLTSRERQVVKLVEQGLSNKEIAVSLRIKQATVKNHVHRILEKLQATRRTDIIRRSVTAASRSDPA